MKTLCVNVVIFLFAVSGKNTSRSDWFVETETSGIQRREEESTRHVSLKRDTSLVLMTTMSEKLL